MQHGTESITPPVLVWAVPHTAAVMLTCIMRPPMAPFWMSHCPGSCPQVCQHVLVATLVLPDTRETPPAAAHTTVRTEKSASTGSVQVGIVQAPTDF